MTITKRVIALRDSDRIERFLAQPQAEGFVVFDAVDGRKGEGYDLFDVDSFKMRYGHEPHTGEVGCAASHFRVLSEFVSNAQGPGQNDWLLVAEDDAVLSPNTSMVIEAVVKGAKGSDCIVLADAFGEADTHIIGGKSEYFSQISPFARKVFSTKGLKYKIGRYAGELTGTGLYLMSFSAAERYVSLVRNLHYISWEADDYQLWPHLASIKVERLRPNLAGWEGRSTIRDLDQNSPSYNRPNSKMDKVKSRIALRSRMRVFRQSSSIALREIADALEKPLE